MLIYSTFCSLSDIFSIPDTPDIDAMPMSPTRRSPRKRIASSIGLNQSTYTPEKQLHSHGRKALALRPETGMPN